MRHPSALRPLSMPRHSKFFPIVLWALGWMLSAAALPAQDQAAPIADAPSTATTTTTATPALLTPTTAPQVAYEGQPSSNIEKTGGALPAEGSEAVATEEPQQPTTTQVVKEMPIEALFDRIRNDTGVTLEARGKTAAQKISIAAKDKTVEQILDEIAKPQNWTWVKRADGSYAVYDQETYVSEVLSGRVQRKTFHLKFIDAMELNKVIEPTLTPEIGATSADERTNSLIVTDLPDKLALIESIIAEYDIQLYTHVFELLNADTEELADRLNEMKSKYSEIHVDPINHLIIVKDETLVKIKIMEQLVELMDRDQEIRVYNLNLIGTDGEDADDMIEAFIEPIITQDAVLEFNKATSQLYVKDVHAVQQKILDILRQVDRPRKQVMIEGELLSVSVDHSLSIGMNWTFGSSLLDAINTQKIDAPAGVDPGTPKKTQLMGFPITQITPAEGLRFTEMTQNVRAELNAVMSDSRTRLLLRPRLILKNHEEGAINISRREPILNTFFSDNGNNNNGFSSSGQSFVDTGLELRMIPAISNRGLIEMDVFFKNSVPIIVPDIGGGRRGVGESAEEAETFMVVPSGETRVIGGLITEDRSNGSSGVPFLSEIPYLGFLFGSKSNENTLRNLMFFITPTIIDSQPTNDDIVEPVNERARLAMTEEFTTATPPESINEIPAELRPYLEQIRPDGMPYRPEDALSTATVTTTGTLILRPAASAQSAQSLLTDEPVPQAPTGDLIKVGGAGSGKKGLSGPSGTFGGPVRPATIPRKPAAPEATPAPAQPGTQPEQPEQPEQPAQPGTAGPAAPEPTPVPAPAQPDAQPAPEQPTPAPTPQPAGNETNL